MRKKFLIMLLFMLALLLGSVPAFAGDIPEGLLHSEDAQIFFGEVLEYHPDQKNPTITVSPEAVIKGEIEKGERLSYARPNPVGNYEVQIGEIYLFTYYDEHNDTDIFEVTTYDTRTLKLRHVDGNMWERLETYLNEGKYGHARVEGRVPYYTWLNYGIVGVLICVSGFAGLFFYKKRKKV